MGKPAGAGFAIVAFINLLLLTANINTVMASASDRMLNMVDGCDTSAQWQPFNESCYQHLKLDPPKGWKDANEQCAYMGSHLATIRTKAENDFIIDNMLPTPETDQGVHNYEMWIGLRLQWATCDDCNNVQSGRWVDDTPVEESELLPKPITLLRNKYGKYPWKTGGSQVNQPDRNGMSEGCTSYFITKGYSVGGWGMRPCDDSKVWALCQKKKSSQ